MKIGLPRFFNPMALIDADGLIIRGKIGAVTFVYRKGTNFTRVNTGRKDAKSPAQLAHRAEYGQLQKLGSLWNRDFIVPYFQGDIALESPYNRFIKHNWQLWNKSAPAWQCALPFWNIDRVVEFQTFVDAAFAGSSGSIKIKANIPAVIASETSEFYGFYTIDTPAHFVKFTAQRVVGEGWQIFNTGLDAATIPQNTFYVCWLQSTGTTGPLCMPVNQGF